MKKSALALVLLFTVSLFSFAEEKENHPKRDYVPYRGMRVTTENQEFRVMSVMAQKEFNGENSLMEITLRFSMPIDPRTVNAGTVLLNGKKCDSNVFFHFGRKGESVRITIVNTKDDSYSLKLSGIESYKGDKLTAEEYDNIQNGTEIIKGRR